MRPTARKPSLRAIAIGLVSTALLAVGAATAVRAMLNDEQAALEELEEVVSTVAAESVAVTNGYLAVAQSSVELLSKLLARESGASREDLPVLLGSVVAVHSHLDGAYVGYPDGSFVHVRRDGVGPESGLVLKEITIGADGRRTVSLARLDQQLGRSERTTPEVDRYDPRIRPWYVEAAASKRSIWTDVYTFYESREPGVTKAVAVRDGDELLAVVGIDVRLSELQRFLRERRPSDASTAMVINAAGDIIASSSRATSIEAAAPIAPGTDEAALARFVVDDVGPVARARAGRPVVQTWSADANHAVAAASVGGRAQWFLGVAAPEDDFLQTLRRENRRNLILAASIGAALLAVAATVIVIAHGRLVRLRRSANTDPLTGALNRGALLRHLERALERANGQQALAIMLVDLDKFKQINDTFGHERGDQVLVATAERLVDALGVSGTVGRLGGDEFLLIVTDLDDGAVDEAQWSAIMEAAMAPLPLPGATVEPQLSGGISFQLPHEQKSATQMMREADIALYVAKEEQVPLRVFAPTMQLPSKRDRRRLAEFQTAITNGEFALHYQPEIDLRSGEMHGAEALLRWNHPLDGTRPADEFIEELERCGLLDDLLPALLDQAIDFVDHYRDRPFTLRLNVAVEQLDSANFVPSFARAVEAAPTTSFCVEITERTMAATSSNGMRALVAIRKLGVSVALDDFGTGYSSLQRLQWLPVDAIKIDRGFVQELVSDQPDRSLLSAIIRLGELMELDVVAEGIETPTQRTALAALGCERGQGFLLGRPLEPADFLDRWPPTAASVS